MACGTRATDASSLRTRIHPSSDAHAPADTSLALPPLPPPPPIHREFIENEEAVRIVDVFYNKGLPAIDACRYLIARAAIAWRKFEGSYRDDITAVVVYLDLVLEQLSAEVAIAEEEGEDE